ncbi:MAG: hypothetical protein J7M38_14805, partial [Armatimonadetes bacterium]|nr:hypothetical protein [Armatimonadota bacterium]
VYIAEAAFNHSAAIAGEGSGGIVFPAINYAHDSIAALAHILQLMATREAKLSELVADIPEYFMVKRTVACPPQRSYSVLSRLREDLDADWIDTVNLDDGIKLIGADRWVHVRASMTEPCIRVIAEAPGPQMAQDMADSFMRKVARLL